MRAFWVVALLCALIGCGDKSAKGAFNDAGLKGFRTIKRTDPVGTVFYERGLQWLGTDQVPHKVGKLEKLPHRTDAGKEVVLYVSDADGKTRDWETSSFYELGTIYVKE